VRVLRPEFAGQPHTRAQFLDLSKRALLLVHENLVVTRETRAFPDENIYYTVRDYVNGVTLQKVLEGGKRFEPDQIVRLLRQLLAALGAVHRRGMCHGGVKPSNVFLCEDDRVILGDPSQPAQGIGVALDRLSYDYRYAAPESFHGAGAMGIQSDLYSLGCVAYELACGAPPFVSDNYLELAANHMYDAIVEPSHRGSNLESEGDEVLLRLLATSPTGRYSKTEDVLQALDRLEESWRRPLTQAAPEAPLLRDASLARYQGAESVFRFDAPAVPQRQTMGDFGLAKPPALDTLPGGPPTFEVAPELPSKIGAYQILEALGRGGMGVVYKARDPRLDRVVAIKLLPARLGAGDLYQRERFEREGQAAARLQHPNIVSIYDTGEYQGSMYLALEYVSGGNLAEKPLAEGPQQVRAAAEMVAKLARAVQHAHERGILHRDLKPANILLTEDGQPKITDFGLAKLSAGDPALTHAGMIIGTPSYMAPEQAAGNVKQIGPATDVYGLGGILYQLLTGRPPFRADSLLETMSQLASQPVTPPSALNSAVDPALEAICLKCLEKESSRRYTSAADLANDLECWARGEAVTAAPSWAGRWRRVAQWFMGLGKST
jgi:serine/threonine-protein kinase